MTPVCTDYRCVCSCGTYETVFDMTYGTALKAAQMHVMLNGSHTVHIQRTGEAGQFIFVGRIQKGNQ